MAADVSKTLPSAEELKTKKHSDEDLPHEGLKSLSLASPLKSFLMWIPLCLLLHLLLKLSPLPKAFFCC